VTIASPNTNSDYEITLPEFAGSLVTSADLTVATAAVKIQMSTAVATTSGSAIDFTGIPAGVNEIVLSLRGVSTNGTSSIMVRLGTAGGIVSTGYAGGSCRVAATTTFSSSTGIGLLVNTTVAAEVVSADIYIRRQGLASNAWNMSYVGHVNTFMLFGDGDVALGDELTQLRLTTSTGTPVFDLGTAAISWSF